MSKYKTRKQIANEYGVSRRTFYTFLKQEEISLSPGLITPKKQEEIYRKLGNPAVHKTTEKE